MKKIGFTMFSMLGFFVMQGDLLADVMPFSHYNSYNQAMAAAQTQLGKNPDYNNRSSQTEANKKPVKVAPEAILDMVRSKPLKSDDDSLIGQQGEGRVITIRLDEMAIQKAKENGPALNYRN